MAGQEQGQLVAAQEGGVRTETLRRPHGTGTGPGTVCPRASAVWAWLTSCAPGSLRAYEALVFSPHTGKAGRYTRSLDTEEIDDNVVRTEPIGYKNGQI